ncbi:zinc finger protein 256 [Engraulis encrasicolus]|uniref:zinc finger protein 256 n=1 Tax=Engraulis encrasicolus TaxID=184585 RepID=UPI002FD13265
MTDVLSFFTVMASEFTIDIQLTELGFHHIPEFDEELPLKDTPSQLSPPCSPPDSPAPSKPPPVTNVPVDPRVLQLVQQNACSSGPRALPAAGTTASTSSPLPAHSLDINQNQDSEDLAAVNNDHFSNETAPSKSNITSTPAATEKEDDGKTAPNEITVRVNFSDIVEKRSKSGKKTTNTEKVATPPDEHNGSNNKERNAGKAATPERHDDAQNDGRTSANTPKNGQKDGAYNDSDDSDVSEQEEEEEEEEEEDTEDDAQYLAPDGLGERPCSVCQQKFNNAFLLREHMHVHTGVRPYRCAECDKQFCHLANYRAHLRSHAQSTPVRCCVCQLAFESEERLQLHLQHTHFEDEFYQCDFCKRIFTSLKDCEIHVHNHRAEAQLPQCPKCGRRFKQDKALRRHLHKRLCQRSYVCSDCGQSFRKKNALLRHSFTHLGMLPYTCTTCDTHFRLARFYRRHECKPEAIRCVACLSTFTSRRDFEEHKKATGCWGSQSQSQTPCEEIRCMECGQTFGTAEELKKHAGSHQRVLKCAECGMGFRSAIMLMSHMGGHVAQRPVLCQECGLGFPHQQLYTFHLKTCGQDPPPAKAKPEKKLKKRKILPDSTPPAEKPKEATTAKVAPTPTTSSQVKLAVPEMPAFEGGWRLRLNAAPPPNTPVVVLIPVSAGVPAGLTISAPEPQNLSLKTPNSVDAPVQPPQPIDGNANTVVNLEQNATVLHSVEAAPQTLPCEPQRLGTLPQLCLDPLVIKKEQGEHTGISQTFMSSFDNTFGASSSVRVKKEEGAEEMGASGFCDENVNGLPLKTEMEMKRDLTPFLKTEVDVKDVILSNVTKGVNDFDSSTFSAEQIACQASEQPEVSNLLISDVRGGVCDTSEWLITEGRCEGSVSESFGSVPATPSQVSYHHDIPMDLRRSNQEQTVNLTTAETVRPGKQHVSETHEVGHCSSVTAVEVDLGGGDRRGKAEAEGESHECVTCGRFILEGDLMQHYMEHAVKDNHNLDDDNNKLPSRSRASSPSTSWCASQDSAPSPGFCTPTSTPPVSPPSKRLRSRAK